MVAAASILNLVPFFRYKNVKRVLDYGAGTLRNSKYLLDKGINVYVVDTPNQLTKIMEYPEYAKLSGLFDPATIARCRLGVDLVLANFVLNIIHNPFDRFQAIQNAYCNLKPGGFFLVEVKGRTDNQDINNAFTCKELDQLIQPHGFNKVQQIHGPRSLAVLYQRAS